MNVLGGEWDRKKGWMPKQHRQHRQHRQQQQVQQERRQTPTVDGKEVYRFILNNPETKQTTNQATNTTNTAYCTPWGREMRYNKSQYRTNEPASN